MGHSSQSIEVAGFSRLHKVPLAKQISIIRTVRNASSHPIFSFICACLIFFNPFLAIEKAVQGLPKCAYEISPNERNAHSALWVVRLVKS